ncbi:MAG: hypothetical protein MJ171_07830 [Clostridia bacterium]|nr:hypothetical protein [Clostridia bacterium]
MYHTDAVPVTDTLLSGHYDLKTRFTLLYLYDYMNDKNSINFVTFYGGKLHNLSSSNVTILTYYSDDMKETWSNVQHREKLYEGADRNNSRLYAVTEDLKRIYRIRELPALILIMQHEDGSENHLIIDIPDNFSSITLFMLFSDLINIINDNCEESFDVISEKICGPGINLQMGNHMSRLNTKNYIASLVKDKSRKTDYPYTQSDLAYELGISERTLRNKRNSNTFTRDECIYIAVRFGISVQDLNALLRANDHAELGLNNRDGVIRNCILSGYDAWETEKELKKNGYAGIILNPELAE